MRLAVRVVDLCKDYVLSGETVHALRGVSFDVPEGDYISIMGPSGSGKSTLLNVLGLLDRPDSGRRDGLGHQRVPGDVQVSAVEPLRLELVRPEQRRDAAIREHRALAGLVDERHHDAVARLLDGAEELHLATLEVARREPAGTVRGALAEPGRLAAERRNPRGDVRALPAG